MMARTIDFIVRKFPAAGRWLDAHMREVVSGAAAAFGLKVFGRARHGLWPLPDKKLAGREIQKFMLLDEAKKLHLRNESRVDAKE
jgi:hypothetical protein